MALYTNTVTVKGYLGKDAEAFATSSQKAVVIFSLATKSGYKDQQKNEWVNHTEWHRIVAFGKPADYARELKKGDYVEVEGELRSTEYEKEVGQGRSKVKVTFRDKEIRASLVKKLDAPAKGESLDAEPIMEDDAA